MINYDASAPLTNIGNSINIQAQNLTLAFDTRSLLLSNTKPEKRRALIRSFDCDKFVDPLFEFNDKIIALEVFANNDLSSAHTADTNLISFFVFINIIPDNDFGTGGITFYDNERFNRLNADLASYTIGKSYKDQEILRFFGLKFNYIPEEALNIRFTVNLIFESGRILSAQAPEVMLLP